MKRCGDVHQAKKKNYVKYGFFLEIFFRGGQTNILRNRGGGRSH